MPRQARRPQQLAQPLSVPRGRGGEKAVAGERLHHATRHLVMGQPLRREPLPRDPVDSLRIGGPIRPSGSGPNEMALLLARCEHPRHLDGIAMLAQRGRLEIEKDDIRHSTAPLGTMRMGPVRNDKSDVYRPSLHDVQPDSIIPPCGLVEKTFRGCECFGKLSVRPAEAERVRRSLPKESSGGTAHRPGPTACAASGGPSERAKKERPLFESRGARRSDPWGQKYVSVLHM